TIRFVNPDFAAPVLVRVATVPLATWEDVVAASKGPLPELAPFVSERHSHTGVTGLDVFELCGERRAAFLAVRRVGATTFYGLGELSSVEGKQSLDEHTVVSVTCALDPR